MTELGVRDKFFGFKMTANYLVNVPKLKGRENYGEWTFAAENFLVLEGMLHCIKPVEGKVIVPADDEKTKAKLIMTIDSTIYVHIKNVSTSKDLWDKLKSLFDDSGFSRKISLLRTLTSIRLENSDSMASYVTQMIETGQKLSGTGFKISDEWIGCLLLAGLTDRYMPMIMAIEHSGICITTDAIKTKLFDMVESDVGEHSCGGAFASSQKWQHRSKNKSMVSGIEYKDKDGGSSGSSNKKVKCYKCKQPGHYKNQCQNYDSNQSNDKKIGRKQTNAFNVVFLSGNFNKYDWYVDSGASAHLTANENWVNNPCYTQGDEIVVANNNKLRVLCTGDVDIVTKTKECEFEVPIKGVLCVPSLTTNLLSVSQLMRNGNKVTFTESGCSIYNKIGDLVAEACVVNGVYKLIMPECLLAASAVSGNIWHRRLGHINSNYLNQMTSAVEGIKLDKKVDIFKSSCSTCCEGKQCRLPFNHVGSRSNEILETIHTDICGPMEVPSIGGSRYFLLYVDDYSRMIFVYFLKYKSEALARFKEFKAKVENQTNKRIKTLRSDNGLEFCNKEFNLYLQKEGVNHQKSNPYTPEQNGLSERCNRTVVEKARCLLFDADLGKEFWAEATNTAVYLHNRIVASGLNGKTPYEMWTGTKPEVSHLRIFGSKAMVHIPKEKRQKWDRKSIEHILVGYPENVKGYRVYNPITRNITTSRDVIVRECEKNTEVNVPVEEPKSSVENIPDSVKQCNQDEMMEEDEDDTLTTKESLDETYSPSENEFEDSEDTPAPISRPVRERKKPERYGFMNMCVNKETLDDANGLTLEEALKGPEREQWLKAVSEELQCFEDNSAWELADAPDNGTIVKCKWVLKKKYDTENNVRYRARLVAKGFMQKEGVDYVETFSPVVRHTTLRLLFALAVQLNLDITHLDVTTAFLNGDLEETIYMQKPASFPNSKNDGKVLRLKKAIYGLKQSSRAWYRKVDDCLISMGYKRSKIESCLYTKNSNKSKTIVTLYVDDFFIFSDDVSETDNLKSVLASHFKLKDLGAVRQCLGMNVSVDKANGVVTLSQESYVNQLLEKFNMLECKTADTPMDAKLSINKSEKCNVQFPYQQLVGSLMYLAVLTRPDIFFSVVFLSQFNNCYDSEHWLYAKRVLRYLKKTKHYGLTYTKNGNSKLKGFVDADWGNNVVDRKSYTGLCFTLSDGAISWVSKKQKSVALSSTEAEYMSITEACKEAMYLRRLVCEITDELYTINVFNDNQGALKLSMNNVFHNRTKHIDIRYHFCRDCVSNNIIKLQYLETAKMPADLLTKSLHSVKHYCFLKALGIQSLH